MEVFKLTLSQMLMMFTFIAIGFLLRKTKILPEGSDTTMSRLETYIFAPGLALYNFMTNCTISTFKENSALILYGLVIVSVMLAMSYPISALFIRNSKQSAELTYQRNIYKYAITYGNYGYVGNFLMLGVFGGEGLFKYQMFTLGLSVLCYSWGLYILIPKGKGNSNPLKALLSPLMISVVVGVIAGILNLKQYLPEFLLTAMSNASDCMGPVAMILAGFVIGGFEFKSLLTSKKVYIITLLRLVIIPAIIALILKALSVDKEIITLALIAFAAPLGLNTVVFPAAYGGDTKTGASMAMISHTLSVITIPLMYLIFVVLL